MNIRLYILFVFILFLSSCKNSNNKIDDNEVQIINARESKGYELMTSYCFTCHREQMPSGVSMGGAAPPMFKVQKKYKQASPNKEEFVNQIMNWVEHPSDDKLLLTRAIFVFGEMPKLTLPENELKQIAETLYYIDYPPHTSRVKVRMPLNNGKKWQIQKQEIQKFETIIDLLKNFKSDDVKEYWILRKRFTKLANKLTLDRSVSSQLRTKFYLYFFEIDKSVYALSQVKSAKDGEVARLQLLQNMLHYTYFFEEI
jgi:hypothetical protein